MKIVFSSVECAVALMHSLKLGWRSSGCKSAKNLEDALLCPLRERPPPSVNQKRRESKALADIERFNKFLEQSTVMEGGWIQLKKWQLSLRSTV